MSKPQPNPRHSLWDQVKELIASPLLSGIGTLLSMIAAIRTQDLWVWLPALFFTIAFSFVFVRAIWPWLRKALAWLTWKFVLGQVTGFVIGVVLLLTLLPSAMNELTSFFGLSTSVISQEISMQPNSTYSMHVYNCDDVCQIYVENQRTSILDVTYGKDSGWVDITRYINDKRTNIKIQVVNADQRISYGLQIRRDGDAGLIVDEKCGVVGSIGCEGDRNYPKGVVAEFSYIFVRP